MSAEQDKAWTFARNKGKTPCMKWIYLIMALAVGMTVPLQAGINVRLREALSGEAALAALVSFAVGTLALFIYAAAAGPGFGLFAGAFSRGPLWMWTGGLLGAVFVATTIILAANLGAANMLVWLIAGQLLAGLLMDHYGLIGYTLREASGLRILGAALVVIGAVMVQKF